MKLGKITLVVLYALSFVVQGCASIVSKSKYPVTITSAPETSNIRVSNRNGDTVFSGTTPATVTLKAGAGYFKGESYLVHFEKEGFETQTLTIKQGLDFWYIFNFLIGGSIGYLIVDPLTGAMYKLPPSIDAILVTSNVSLSRPLLQKK